MRTPTITTTMDRPVNLFRAITTCNAFYIFLSAAKAALLPFLTLFFYIIGLSAMETGIIMAAKTLTGFVWAPLWARCAAAYNKRRLILVFSLLMMSAMYMSFIAVYYKVGNPQICQPVSQSGNVTSHFPNQTSADSDSISRPNNGSATSTGQSDISNQHTRPLGEGDDAVTIPSVVHTNNEEGTNKSVQLANSSKLDTAGTGDAALTTVAPLHSSSLPQPAPTVKESATENSLPESHAQNRSTFSDSDLEKLQGSLEDIKEAGRTTSDLYTIMNQKYPEDHFTEADIEKFLELAKTKSEDDQPVVKRSTDRFRRTLNFTFWNDFTDKVGMVTATLEEKKLLLFLVILLVIIFGEFFSSPVEKIADDAWFDFLERIDDMEKYGRQRYWGSLTFALVPIVVTIMVDYTPCNLMNLHHFLLHFFVFGIFMIFTLFLAFYFPMPPPVKQKYSSKVGKGLRVICCDGRGFLFVITLLVAGSVYASFNNFLFWHLHELGALEVTMGLCVSIGAFAETPMLVFSNKLVRKLGNGGLVALSLIILALRVLYYGFLWTPWAVLPAEITNAFTHTALWYAVLSYDEFNVGSAMDRSIRSILSSFYFGLGFSIGSFVSGVVYHVYGASILFWGASVLSGGWCLVFSLIQCCLPKKERVKYIKLLRNQDDDSSEGDDDWLEMALKDQ